MAEDTPEFNEVSKEALLMALKAKENLNHDISVLTLKIEASMTEIKNHITQIDNYLSSIRSKVKL